MDWTQWSQRDRLRPGTQSEEEVPLRKWPLNFSPMKEGSDQVRYDRGKPMRDH